MKTHVDAEDARPAGKPNECFYCNRKLFDEHTFDCVIPSRMVRLRVTIEYEAEVPRSWDSGTIEFVKKEKGCLSNTLLDIQKYSDRLQKEHPNICTIEHPDVDYLGEAVGMA